MIKTDVRVLVYSCTRTTVFIIYLLIPAHVREILF